MAVRALGIAFILTGWTLLVPLLCPAAESTAGSGEEGKPSQTVLAPEDDYSDMVRIPAGRFRMGFTFQQTNEILEWCQRADKRCTRWWFKDAFPPHFVYLDAFWLDIYEVTNAKYLEFVKATGHRPALDDTCESKACWAGNLWKGNSFPKEIANQPVSQIAWEDARAYCEWRAKRLPTEAEWEKAARGPAGNLFPWGNDRPPGKATYRRKWRGIYTMTDVGSYPHHGSLYGVHDMAGNVWEWVSDWYDKDYYKHHPKRNPKGPEEGEFKVLRGGSWVNNEDTLVSAYRRWSRPEVRFNDTGFRCARDAVPGDDQ